MSKETCELDYKAECEKLKNEICFIKDKNEKELIMNNQIWQQTVESQNKEIEWLKSVINGILHI